MKRLILLRHAKSDWSEPGLSDHARHLNARGLAAAPKLGRWLKDNDILPDQVLCSTATRARETFAGVEATLRSGVTPDYIAALYLAEPATMLKAIRVAKGTVVLLIAHNPGIAELAEMLAETPPDDMDFFRYPTGAVTVLDFEIDDWAKIKTGACTGFVIPRNL